MGFLEAEGVTRRFGGLAAVDDLSFEVREGEILGIIGPNGAGKTTLLNLISALLPVTAGAIQLRGRPITGLAPHEVAHLGVARTFQIVKPLKGLSVRENVAVGAMFGQSDGGRPTRPALAKADQEDAAAGAGRFHGKLPDRQSGSRHQASPPGPPIPSPSSPSRTASA